LFIATVVSIAGSQPQPISIVVNFAKAAQKMVFKFKKKYSSSKHRKCKMVEFFLQHIVTLFEWHKANFWPFSIGFDRHIYSTFLLQCKCLICGRLYVS